MSANTTAKCFADSIRWWVYDLGRTEGYQDKTRAHLAFQVAASCKELGTRGTSIPPWLASETSWETS